MIEYIKGDLFDTDCKYIAHGCNCQGVMGSGVAKTVRELYPECFKAYSNYCEKHHNLGPPQDSALLLGRIVEWTDGDIHILNCFTQDYYGKNGDRFVSYDAVERCFRAISNNNIPEVAMPKIGAGLGGGDWTIIEAIINATLIRNGVKVKVYEL
jgi:O-acetyl-ADP-ribose deacetylase (regulator of RNase III)